MYLDNGISPTDFLEENCEEIEKIYSSSSISYIFHKENLFSETKYKIFKGMLDSWFLKSVKILYNGNIKLIYMNSGCKSLKEMMPYLNEDEFLLIMMNLLKSMKEIQENGFLDYGNLQLNVREMFIEPNTLDIKLIYLPLSHICNSNVSEHQLRQELINILNDSSIKSKEKIKNIYNELLNERQPLTAVYYIICSLYGNQNNMKIQEKKKNIVPEIHKEQNQPILFLCSCENNTVFKVEKEEFIIGRGGDRQVDGVVTFNRSIGRAHCKFVYQNDEYCVVDLKSMNYTYLNGRRLKPNQLYKIIDGDNLRLANSDFQIQIQRG